MDFVNHTPFPGLAFEGIDQYGQSFHVAVLRQTLTWDGQGTLSYADEQAPVCEVDQFLGVANQSVVRQESDLCHHKPRCDVIVNAVAHAPQGRPTQCFGVCVIVRRPGLDAALLEKTLVVTGPRRFFCKNEQTGQTNTGRSKVWRLSDPEPTQKLPLHSKLAFGGECRINRGEPLAQQLSEEFWLTPEQLTGHPDAQKPVAEQPAAHSVFEANPIGMGYARQWYLDATGLTELPAPQIEYPDKPMSAELLVDCLTGRLTEEHAAKLIAGLGVRPKAHPERRTLVGTLSEAFVNSDAWLPQDFDFAIWNAVPPDQQTDYLEGDEIIELTNLCAWDAPGAAVDGQSDTLLRLALPSQECFVLVRLESGGMFTHAMVIDTVVVEPEIRRLSLVWRTVLGKEADEPIRKVEARMHSFAERDAGQVETERDRALHSPDQDAQTAIHEAQGEPTPKPESGQESEQKLPHGHTDEAFDAWVREVLDSG